MRAPKNVYITGVLLFVVTTVLFLLVTIFFKDDTYIHLYSYQYYRTILFVCSFLLTTLYALMDFRMLYTINKKEKLSFLQNFRFSFMALFIGGSLSMVFIYYYFNHIDPSAINIIANQQLDWMLSFGENPSEVSKLEKQIQVSNARNVNVMSFDKIFGAYFPVIIVYYLFISFILASFFKK